MSIDIGTILTLLQAIPSSLELVKEIKSKVDNWVPGSETERKVIDDFIYFLSDRRVLYRPVEYEVLMWVAQSAREIKKEILATHKLLDRKDHSETRGILETMRKACVNFIEVTEKVDNIQDDEFLKALTVFRSTILFWVDLVATKLHLDVPPDIKLATASFLGDGNS